MKIHAKLHEIATIVACREEEATMFDFDYTSWDNNGPCGCKTINSKKLAYNFNERFIDEIVEEMVLQKIPLEFDKFWNYLGVNYSSGTRGAFEYESEMCSYVYKRLENPPIPSDYDMQKMNGQTTIFEINNNY